MVELKLSKEFLDKCEKLHDLRVQRDYFKKKVSKKESKEIDDGIKEIHEFFNKTFVGKFIKFETIKTNVPRIGICYVKNIFWDEPDIFNFYGIGIDYSNFSHDLNLSSYYAASGGCGLRLNFYWLRDIRLIKFWLFDEEKEFKHEIEQAIKRETLKVFEDLDDHINWDANARKSKEAIKNENQG